VPAADGTTLSADASAYLTAQRAASSALRDRAQQVKALRSSVNSGDYRVPPDALYDALTAVLTQGGEFR
jgi:type II secretory pathway component PulM